MYCVTDPLTVFFNFWLEVGNENLSLSLERMPKISEVTKFKKVLWKTNQEKIHQVAKFYWYFFGGEQLCVRHHKSVWNFVTLWSNLFACFRHVSWIYEEL